MMTDEEKVLVKDSFRAVAPHSEALAQQFYAHLFGQKPALRALFPSDAATLRARFVSVLGFVVRSIDWPDSAWRDDIEQEDDLFLVMLAIGRRHGDLYRMPEDGYESASIALCQALEATLGSRFSEATRAAWMHLCSLLVCAVKMGRLSARVPRAVARTVQAKAGVW
jgi:hemoglobin-like flavoprotein